MEFVKGHLKRSITLKAIYILAAQSLTAIIKD